MLDELITILNYEGTNSDIQSCIEDLIDSDLTSSQEELIFSLAALAYEQGRDEEC